MTIQETLETQKGENPFSVVMMIFKGTIAMISRVIDQILERLTKVSQIQCDLNVASLCVELCVDHIHFFDSFDNNLVELAWLIGK